MLKSLVILSLSAQNQASLYPVPVSQIGHLQGFMVPGLQSQRHTWEMSAFSKVYTGLFRNNNLSLFSASLRLPESKAGHFHSLGAYLYYDKEGNHIHRYRGYLQYTYTIKLSERWYSSFGASLGLSTHRIGNADYIAGGQDNAADGGLGVSLYDDKSTLGLSVLQVPQGTIQPLVEQSLLRRYYNAYIKRDLDINATAVWRNSLTMSVYKDRPMDLVLSSGWVHDELISFTMLYRWNKSLGAMLGLEKIKINKHELRFYISYDFNISKSYRNNSAELTLKYGLPYKKKKVTKGKR